MHKREKPSSGRKGRWAPRVTTRPVGDTAHAVVYPENGLTAGVFPPRALELWIAASRSLDPDRPAESSGRWLKSR